MGTSGLQSLVGSPMVEGKRAVRLALRDARVRAPASPLCPDLGRAKTYKSRTVISCTFTPSLTQSPIVAVDEKGVNDAFPSASSG